jgi:hypothetical protein
VIRKSPDLRTQDPIVEAFGREAVAFRLVADQAVPEYNSVRRGDRFGDGLFVLALSQNALA